MRVIELFSFEKTKSIARILLTMALSCVFTPAEYLGSVLPNTGVNSHDSILGSAAFLEPVEDQFRVALVEVPGMFSYPVLKFDNQAPDVGVGQYRDVTQWKSIGLIAHNYSVGDSFFELSPGMEVQITFNNGENETFTVYNVMLFQATNPNSFRYPFISSEGDEIQVKDLITIAYKPGELTFQTCIAAEGSMTWGLFFVQAKPENFYSFGMDLDY